jgi:maltose alpha-D-glucosyltransferase/alpha-amylase
VLEKAPQALVAGLQGAGDGVLYDALELPEFSRGLLQDIVHNRRYASGVREVAAIAFVPAGELADIDEQPPSFLGIGEQVNTAVVFGERAILKSLRRVELGVHPEVEIGRHLTLKGGFEHAAAVLGTIEYRRSRSEIKTLAVLHRFVANQGTAWQHSLDELSQFYERVLSLPAAEQQPPVVRSAQQVAAGSLLELGEQEKPAAVLELIGHYLESARLLGQRTAELHLALALDHEDPAFVPEPFSQMYQRSVYQSLRNTHRRALDRLQEHQTELPEAARHDAQEVLSRADELLHRFGALLERRFTGQRIRCHGNYHLAEVLFTGKDFVILDFEGEPGRSLTERRIKRSPLRDVASMIRSFHYAAEVALRGEGSTRGHAPGWVRPEDVALLEPWAWTWYVWTATTFLKAYLSHAGSAVFLPSTRAEVQSLLEMFVLEKGLQELNQELIRRPEWARIPLHGLLRELQRR